MPHTWTMYSSTQATKHKGSGHVCAQVPPFTCTNIRCARIRCKLFHFPTGQSSPVKARRRGWGRAVKKIKTMLSNITCELNLHADWTHAHTYLHARGLKNTGFLLRSHAGVRWNQDVHMRVCDHEISLSLPFSRSVRWALLVLYYWYCKIGTASVVRSVAQLVPTWCFKILRWNFLFLLGGKTIHIKAIATAFADIRDEIKIKIQTHSNAFPQIRGRNKYFRRFVNTK